MTSVAGRSGVVGGRTTQGASTGTKRRVVSLDALRGLALLMLLLVNIAGIRSALPYQLGHAEWHGLTFSDTFFPVFLFTMGAAMAFSSKAQSFPSVARRVVLLFAFGVALALVRGNGFQLSGILQKIAVAYLFAWLVTQLPERFHLPAALGIVVAMWAAFLWVPAPGVVPGSWERGTNFAAFLDRLVIGHPATEGFATAIMATANVVGGTVVIRSIRGRAPGDALGRLVVWGVASVALALVVLAAGVPVNKRIWTPSFTILTHGIACLYLAAFWWLSEVRDHGRWFRPLVVYGRNPILIYVGFTVLHVLLEPVRVPVMDATADVTGALAASLLWSLAMMLVAWAVAGTLDRRRIYLRV